MLGPGEERALWRGESDAGARFVGEVDGTVVTLVRFVPRVQVQVVLQRGLLGVKYMRAEAITTEYRVLTIITVEER